MTRRTASLLLALCLVSAAHAEAKMQTVYLIRHAEKAAGPGRDPPLSPAGRARAERLPARFADALPAAVFANEFRRTQQTARPLALAAGVPIRMLPAATATDALLARLCALPDGAGAVVFGHSNTLPALAQAWSGQPTPMMAEDDYGQVYVLRLADCRVTEMRSERY